MKKTFLLFVFLLAFIINANSQIVFQENFNSVANGGMPAGWTRFNLDGLTPNTSITGSGGLNQPCDSAWNCYDESAKNWFGSMAAWSVSYFNPVGTANRWMFTPAIVVPATNAVLQYSELRLTVSGEAAQGYELHIMTTAPTSSSILTSPILYTSTNAGAVPKQTIDLTAYAGQTVYIGWRNNESTKAALGIDDVVVQSLPSINANLVSINTADYVATGNTNITGTIKNDGLNQ